MWLVCVQGAELCQCHKRDPYIREQPYVCAKETHIHEKETYRERENDCFVNGRAAKEVKQSRHF